MPIQKWSDEIWVVSLEDEPALSEDLVGVREEAGQATPVPNLVLDMTNVKQINSSNLSQMLRLRKLMVDSNRRLRLAGLSDSVWAVFLTTGLDKVFAFTSDVTSALASLQIDS